MKRGIKRKKRIKIRPCPGCGSHSLRLDALGYNELHCTFTIVCNDCGYEGPECWRSVDAAREWNEETIAR